MWEIDNTTPFPSTGMFLKDADGQSLWVVGVKTTFEFRDSQPCLFTPKQIAPFHGPVFANDDTQADMLADTDICLPKPQVDVLVDGLAYPPAAIKPEQPYLAGLTVGPLSKVVQVNPPSAFSSWMNVAPIEHAPHTPVPLRYGESCGGVGIDANPIGLGHDPAADPAQTLVPRLSLPDIPLKSAKKPVPPVGLTAIPRGWAARAALGGTYDAAWQRRRAPVLPQDLSPDFWQAAPPDQRFERDAARGAQVTLTNMTSTDGAYAGEPVSFTLPDLHFEISIRFRSRWTQLEPALQTVHIYTEARMLSLFYLATLPIEAAQNDVLVDKTSIALEDTSGFRVRPEHASLFESDAQEEALI